MASTYSPNLRLELIGTGEQQGSWGTTTNTNLGTLLEEAIGGYVSVAVTDGADTVLTSNNGSADQSRNMVINLTGALTGARTVICPAIEKVYIVRNATTGGFAVTFKVSGQTGVSIPNGATFVLYVDGTDVRQATGSIASGGTGASTAAGAATNLGLGTGDSPQFTAVNIGHASDTTITRSAAGVLAVEGGVIPKENRANTFTANQIISVTDNSNAALRVTQLGTGEAFRVEDSTNPDSTPFVINATGAVGIGTASPGTKLQVTDYISSLATSSGFRFGSASDGTTGQLVVDASNTYLDFTNALLLRAAGTFTERMRIDSSGNVGIGKTPANGLLDVNGAIAATNYRVDGAYPNYQWYPTTGTADQRSFRIQVDTGNFSIIGQNDSGTQQNFPFQIAWGGDISTYANTLVKGSGVGLGYGTGSGGAVTQGTNRTTGVTLNKTNGAITLVSAAGSTTWQTFTVTNSTVAATDTVIVSQKSGTDLNEIHVTNVAAGSFKISFRTTGGTTTEQPVFNFAVIKAVTS